MVYASGQTVEASDYNTLAALIDDVFGLGTGDSGYGGNSINTGVAALPTISLGEVIQSATGAPGSPDEWINLRNAISDCATHQNTTLTDALPSDSLLEDGDIVTFFNTLQSATNSTDLDTNRNNVNLAHLSLSTLGTSVRSTSWTSFVRHEFTVDFGSEDDARHFFNTGGKINIGATRTGGSASSQNAAWTALLTANSPYIFTQADYFALTTSFVTKLSVSSGGAYASNNWAVRAKADAIPNVRGGAGSVLRIRSDFTDGHFTGFEDLVDGTLTSTIQQNKSVAIFPISSPTFATITELTAGS